LLYCGGYPRRNLSGYDVIEFYMHAADPEKPPASPTFRATNWYANSNTVLILDHIEGVVLDGDWRRRPRSASGGDERQFAAKSRVQPLDQALA